FFVAVLGATVARETGLKVGDKFQPSHSGGPEAVVHNEEFTVLGILEPTGTPNDRAVIIHMEGFYLMPEQRTASDLATAKMQATEGTYRPVPLDKRELTGVLVMPAIVPGTNLPELTAMPQMKAVNEGHVAQSVQPIKEMRTLCAT